MPVRRMVCLILGLALCAVPVFHAFADEPGTEIADFFALAVPEGASGAELEIAEDNTFYFGRFEQDSSMLTEPEPILWRILDVDWGSGNMLALSEYGLYTMNYHHSKDTPTLWGDSDVRNWLNRDFAAAAFTEEERKHIAETQVSDSTDRVFLLDEAQIKKYLTEPYLCKATPYALATGAYVNEKTNTSSWLVRTDLATERIPWVGGAGTLYSQTGSKGVNYQTSSDNVVRPAMWINREEINDGVLREQERARPKIVVPTLDSTISTRSGPSQQYNGIGDYREVYEVEVLSCCSDGSTMWLEVEFPYKGLMIRCYTGLKRVAVDIGDVPADPYGTVGTAAVIREPSAYYGPGTNYKKQVEKFTPTVGTAGEVIGEENGWYCFQYEMIEEGSKIPTQVRVWLPAEDVEMT